MVLLLYVGDPEHRHQPAALEASCVRSVTGEGS